MTDYLPSEFKYWCFLHGIRGFCLSVIVVLIHLIGLSMMTELCLMPLVCDAAKYSKFLPTEVTSHYNHCCCWTGYRAYPWVQTNRNINDKYIRQYLSLNWKRFINWYSYTRVFLWSACVFLNPSIWGEVLYKRLKLNCTQPVVK